MDVTESNFQTEVIEGSKSAPVVVDFWAAWCAPCRMLGPILEREAAIRSDKLKLVKLDVDSNPALAQLYGIQGIPAVKAFRNGRVVADFVGAQPAAAVARFLDSLVPSEADLLAQKGDEESLRRALEIDSERADAALPLARILHGRGQNEQALEILSKVHGNFEADGLAARIRLERTGSPEIMRAFSALDAGEYEQALEMLINEISRNRAAREEIRRVVVGAVDELGQNHPRATEWRSRLYSALY